MKPEECFWNGKSSEFHGYNPCAEVVEAWKDTIVIFESRDTPWFENQPAFKTPVLDLYPSGNWVAISRDSEMLDHVGDKETVLREGRLFLDGETFRLVLEHARPE